MLESSQWLGYNILRCTAKKKKKKNRKAWKGELGAFAVDITETKFTTAFNTISMSGSDTIVSAYTLYRHLQNSIAVTHRYGLSINLLFSVYLPVLIFSTYYIRDVFYNNDVIARDK